MQLIKKTINSFLNSKLAWKFDLLNKKNRLVKTLRCLRSGDMQISHLFDRQKKVLECNKVNICFNLWIEESYKPGYDNVLIAIETPPLFREQGWIKDYMTFVAEISW